MALHELKTAPAYFKAVKDGIKNFEIRKDDRGFKIGDELLLKEYKVGKDGNTGKYTGAICHRKVLYVLRGFDDGMKEGYVGLGLERI